MNTSTPSRLASDLNRLERETGMLLATVDSLSQPELAQPSRCRGWTLGHVVAHLTENADAMTALVHDALGQPVVPEAAVDPKQPVRELKRGLTAACQRFQEAAESLRRHPDAAEVEYAGRTIALQELVAHRITEVVLHHYDLGTIWDLEEADPESQWVGLQEGVRRLQESPDAPSMVLRTHEKDEWRIGDGGPLVSGSRAGMLAWISRGDDAGVRSEWHLPPLPAFG